MQISGGHLLHSQSLHLLWQTRHSLNTVKKPPKNIEDSIKNGLIITVTTTGIFFAFKAANEKPPKMSFDAMDIMKLAGGICGGVLVEDYAVYQKWIKE